MADRRLEDAAEIVMGQSPPGETCNVAGEGVPLLNGPTEYGPHHPLPVQFTTGPRKRAQQGDVLFCVRGSTTGRMNWADQEYAIGRGVAAIRHKRTPGLQPLVRAVIEYGLPRLLAQATGSTFPNVSANQLSGLWWPPLGDGEQRAIAHILGTLDDKIELNRRMNETLGEMARALFKSWFVDFDPVRAKAEGRNLGLPKHLADLFPDSFERSTLGEIPQSWEILALSACIEADRGLSYKGAGLAESGMPMHNLNSIFEGGGYKLDGIKHYQGEYKPHHVTHAGDLIVANTEQGHKRLLIGYAAIIPARFGDTTLFSHHIYRVRPKRSTWLTRDWLCLLLNSRTMHDTVSGYANGTTVNMLPVDGLQSPLVVVPPSALVRAFDGLAVSVRNRQGEMTDENVTLTDFRDALLPKLISGELRIKDAESFLKRIST